MFDPIKFLEFAKELIDENPKRECIIRTIINRAYWATYLKSKKKLEDCGCVFPRREQDYSHHKRVEDYLYSESQSIHLKNLYYGLRQLRGEADYVINQEQKIRNAKRAIKLAEEIIKRIELI